MTYIKEKLEINLCDISRAEREIVYIRKEALRPFLPSTLDLLPTIFFFSVQRFKQRIEFVPVNHGDLYSTLDGAKVADSVMFVMSPETGLDRFGESCISCLMGQGLPSVTLVVQV